jgi:hypothetical protein
MRSLVGCDVAAVMCHVRFRQPWWWYGAFVCARMLYDLLLPHVHNLEKLVGMAVRSAIWCLR